MRGHASARFRDAARIRSATCIHSSTRIRSADRICVRIIPRARPAHARTIPPPRRPIQYHPTNPAYPAADPTEIHHPTRYPLGKYSTRK